MSNYERVDRLLRPLNTSDGRDVIELLVSQYYEFNEEWDVDNYNNEMKEV